MTKGARSVQVRTFSLVYEFGQRRQAIDVRIRRAICAVMFSEAVSYAYAGHVGVTRGLDIYI